MAASVTIFVIFRHRRSLQTPEEVPAEKDAKRRPRKPRSKQVKLLLSNLPTHRQTGVKEELLQALRDLPGFKRLKVPKNSHGHHRGYAHVVLEGVEKEAAVELLAKQRLRMQERELFVSVAQTRDKRQSLFGNLPEAQRQAVELDSVAIFSTTDADTADRMAQVLHNLLAVLYRGQFDGARTRVLDLCAGIGGNSMAFLREFGSVVALESDLGRRQMLERNLQRLHGEADLEVPDRAFALDFLADPRRSFDVIFADPPWGGPQYSKKAEIPDLYLAGEEGSDGSSFLSMTALCRSVIARRSACLVVFKLPKNFDFTALAKAVTTPAMTARRPSRSHPSQASTLDERPFPFRMEFGVTQLLIIGLLYPPRHLQRYDLKPINHDGPFLLQRRRRTRPPKDFVCENAKLDDMVASLRRFNEKYHLEHHPRFWDWECERWIPLSRWKGYHPPAPENNAEQA